MRLAQALYPCSGALPDSRKNDTRHCSAIGPNGHCPNPESHLHCTLDTADAILRHMLQLHQRITLQRLQTAVARNAAAMIIHLHDGFLLRVCPLFRQSDCMDTEYLFLPSLIEIVIRHLSQQTRQRLQTVQQAAAAYTPVLPQDRRCGACRCAA